MNLTPDELAHAMSCRSRIDTATEKPTDRGWVSYYEDLEHLTSLPHLGQMRDGFNQREAS